MALSFELSGEQMPTGFGSGTPPLAQLQPLQFHPVQIQAPQFIPNTASEKIGAGVMSAFGEIGKGITAAYQSKKEVEKEDRKFSRDVALKKMEIEAAKAKKDETLENSKALIDYRNRTRNVLPKGIMPKFKKDESAGQQTPSSEGAFSSINLPNQFDDGDESDEELNRSIESMPNLGGAGENPPPPEPITIGEKPLSQITNPVKGNAYDLVAELKNLGGIDAKYKSADVATGAPSTPEYPAGTSLDWLRKPVSVLKESGAISPDYKQASEALKGITTPADIAAEQAKKAAVSGDTPLSASLVTNERPPRTGFSDEETALDYIQNHPKGSNWFAKESPTYDSKTGTWWVKWEQKDPTKMAQAESTKQMAKDRLSRLDQAGLSSEVDKFLKDPINKIMQARPMQIAEFQAAMDEAFDPQTKKSRRAVDLDAIDKFVMFARGTQPTEAQYSEIQNWTQGYLQDVKQKIEKGVEGARLSDNDYETMMNLMYRAYNTTATLVNPEIQDLREIVRAKHPNLMEKELPQVHMYYEVPSYFREKLNDAQDEMRQYHALMDLAKAQKNKSQFDEAKAKYDEAKSRQDGFVKDLARSKASKKPLNMKQFKRGGWRQGLFGGVSDLNAAGASQESQ